MAALVVCWLMGIFMVKEVAHAQPWAIASQETSTLTGLPATY